MQIESWWEYGYMDALMDFALPDPTTHGDEYRAGYGAGQDSQTDRTAMTRGPQDPDSRLARARELACATRLCSWCGYSFESWQDREDYRGTSVHTDCKDHLIAIDKADSFGDDAYDAAIELYMLDKQGVSK